MQQCLQCGQYNEDFEDHCVYCGEPMYIQIDHQTEYKMDDLYAKSIARELIDDNTNMFEDDIDEITRELLGETKENEKNTFIIDGDEFEFDLTEDDINENRDEELIRTEQELKNKIRRNKKLESQMGLIIRNIDIILDDVDGPLLIMGDITTDDKLDNKSVQLSAISYDENKKIISKNDTIVKVDHGNYENFTISLDVTIDRTDIVIILPEMIRYDNTTKEEMSEVKHEEYKKPIAGNNIFLEQLPDIERKIGMTISNTSVLVKSDNNIEIVGEIRIENPDKYHDIKIAATCYDIDNSIIGTESTKINTKLFLGFDTLSIKINNINVNEIQRIKLYPTLQ